MSSASSDMMEEPRRRGKLPLPLDPNYIPTDEEKRVLKECKSDSFWYRSVPAAAATMAITHTLVARGTPGASVRFGSLTKVVFAGFCGYILGKVSYIRTCQEKLKRLENSPIADALRRAGQHPSSANSRQSEPSDSDSRLGYSAFQPTESQSQMPNISRDYGYGYNDEPPMQIERPDDFSGPASYPPNIEDEQPGKKTIMYEDLRLKNRENYKVTLSQKAETPLKAPLEKLAERPKKEAKNVYGDAWEE